MSICVEVLLDTHAFLWLVEGSLDLGPAARQLIGDPTSTNVVSIASIWEIAIKVSLGKLTLSRPFNIYVAHHLRVNGCTVLNITVEHAATVTVLPFHHRDPFDRLIFAQVMEGMTLVSRDSIVDTYGITRVW